VLVRARSSDEGPGCGRFIGFDYSPFSDFPVLWTTPILLFMTEQETAVLTFLQGCPEMFCARKEIARKAVHRSLYEENPHWLDAALLSLTDRGLIEKNDSAQYRIKPPEDSEVPLP
jgi:hypothetical protein